MPQEGHDYGISKRKAAYPFLAKHLGLSLNAITNEAGEVDESFVVVEAREKLRVFDARHVRPTYAVIGDELVSKLLESVIKK